MSEAVNIPVIKEQNEQEVPVVREVITIGGGGHDYTAGEGLLLEDYTFSADTDYLATREDLSDKQDTLTAGDNITIEGDTISATDTTYTAGSNVSIDDGVISATNTTYSAGNGLSLSGTAFSADTSVLATRNYVDAIVGSIEIILGTINSGDGV